MSLFDSIYEYNKKNPHRFHTPGHKGRLSGFDVYGMDITEIPEMDDLHEPAGVIKDMEERLAGLYGAASGHFLVNGTTLGIMCGIFAMIEEGDRVLIQRNSHRCVYNGLMLRKAEPVFIKSKTDKYGITEPVSAETIDQALQDKDRIKLAILTTPTYEGVVINLKDISEILHKQNIPLLVDSAHGAHSGIFGKMQNPISLGADIAVEGLHKTLPFLTQSAALLYSPRGEKYRERVKLYLDCFESSSPSYILMAAGDRGIRILEEKGEELFRKLEENLEIFYNQAKGLSNIRVLEDSGRDQSKIIITLEDAAFKNGERVSMRDVYAGLLSQNIVPEMLNSRYILCMTSIMNTREDFQRLSEVLEEMDKELISEKHGAEKKIIEFKAPKAVMSMGEAVNKDRERLPIKKALGRVAGDFVEIFPPGIPIVLPGEIIDYKAVEDIENGLNANLEVRGIDNGKIICVNG